MRAALLLPSIALLAGSSALAGDNDYPFTINFDFNPPSYSGCTDPAVADGELSCATIDNDLNDYSGAPNYAWVMVGGVPDGTGPGAPGGIGGLQFGIMYDASFIVEGWSLCTGGSEIPQTDLGGAWPDSGRGNAVTWAGGCYLVEDNSEGVTRVGFFTVNSGSDGMIRITEDPRTQEATAAGCDTMSLRLCRQLLGRGYAFGGGERAGDGQTCGFMCAVPTRDTSWGALKAIY